MPRPAGMSSESESEDDGFSFEGSSVTQAQELNHSDHQLSSTMSAFESVSMPHELCPRIDVLQNNNIESYSYSREVCTNGSSASSRENSLKPDWRHDLHSRISPSPSFSDYSSFSASSSGSNRRRRRSSLPLDDLRMALVQGNLPIVKSIINQGVSVDQIMKSGWTPLMFASSRGYHEIVNFLLQKGADPNLHKEMFTPLMAACASSRQCEDDLLSCVEGLLSYGAKPDVAERHRMTALMFAAKEGRDSVVSKLIGAGVDVNKQDNKGWTALSWAATKGYGRVARTLLGASCDPMKTNLQGQTSADIALAAGHSQLADVLERSAFNSEAKKSLPFNDGHSESLSDSISNGYSDLKKYNNCNSVVSRCSEMEMVLSGLGLSDLVPVFQDHKVTLQIFLRLNEDDLVKMGIETLGTRKILLNTINQIHKQEWKTTSLPNLSKQPFITLPDSVAMIKNVNKHLRFIHASIGHLRDEIQATPRILELGQDIHKVSTLSNLLGDSILNLNSLESEVKFFKAHLEKICSTTGLNEDNADTIVLRKDDGKRWQRRLLFPLVISTSLAAFLCVAKPNFFFRIFGSVAAKSEVISLKIPDI